MEAHETHEKIHEAAHHGGGEGHGSGRNKRIAVMISVLACLLALVETGVNSSQNVYMASNIEASNLWAFFQAKSIRMTTMKTAAENAEVTAPAGANAEQSAAVKARIAEWRAAAQRYDSEPETGEGRKELAARAKAAEAQRDHALSAYHVFEYAAAALQIAIVLASAAVVSGVLALALGAGGLGVIGAGLAMLGWLAPTLLHL
jgi:hypothetical protein